jgi:hypothetical protein
VWGTRVGRESEEEFDLAVFPAHGFLFIFGLAPILVGKSGPPSTELLIVFGNFGNEIDLLAWRDAKRERGFPIVVSYRQVTGTNYIHANENITS